MADISLEQATEKACQVESLLRMLESYPDTLSETELSSVITLIRRLSGEVHTWLIEEQAGGRINDYIFNLSQKQS
ncbi:hypothetical protein EH138_17785 [Salmonella enterica subsp. enterica serovar Eastbourne]|uniref:Uncharacterized protein n=1 Tax=Salmonella enterica subsp. enterica serovar Eastbourne TaxID=486993 RepID=A0A702BAZ7_SALET|nr:hypothetical protein [Salmonella enterica subsp. enterica serovar Eastbourne]ECA1897620.1 hypothetical protein [Salmonella enterica subsp. enterica serovar Eastbourne]HAC6678304.1 hypothetical protein [Salmonella enterica subsp. enterica serovar Eastbourne]HAE5115783.1 hypothetical protein [Salmonella enterica subsp. enterica serovar Eastbourne]HAE8030266.1 hypothetical protein [Salmonella enterica subsp. enterica serovar Eastbourne]